MTSVFTLVAVVLVVSRHFQTSMSLRVPLLLATAMQV